MLSSWARHFCALLLRPNHVRMGHTIAISLHLSRAQNMIIGYRPHLIHSLLISYGGKLTSL